MAAEEPNYTKYLDPDQAPTELMRHIESWIRDKADVDPTKFKTKAEAFKYGVYLTVHLRMTHQASPENQERLAANRQAADAIEAEKAERRQARAASAGTKKAAAESRAAEKPASKRRSKAKAVEAVPGVPAAEPATPKRRGRPPKAVAPVAETAEEEAPKRPRGRPRKAAAVPASATATDAVSNVTELPTGRTPRRRPVRRGEAAF